MMGLMARNIQFICGGAESHVWVLYLATESSNFLTVFRKVKLMEAKKMLTRHVDVDNNFKMDISHFNYYLWFLMPHSTNFWCYKNTALCGLPNKFYIFWAIIAMPCDILASGKRSGGYSENSDQKRKMESSHFSLVLEIGSFK